MLDIREIELRDIGSNANTKICFEVRATAICPRLHTEGFSLCPHDLPQGTSIEKLQLNTGNTQLLSLTQTTLHKREGTKAKQRKALQLGDPMITYSPLMILKDHKQFSHNTKILKIDLR